MWLERRLNDTGSWRAVWIDLETAHEQPARENPHGVSFSEARAVACLALVRERECPAGIRTTEGLTSNPGRALRTWVPVPVEPGARRDRVLTTETGGLSGKGRPVAPGDPRHG